MKKEKDKINLTDANKKSEEIINPDDKEKQAKIKAVAKLVKEIIGTRSVRKTAEESGIAASYISGIVNEKYLPSANILSKLLSQKANPQNGITLEEVMVAAGYQENFFDESVNIALSESEFEKESRRGRSVKNRLDRTPEELEEVFNSRARVMPYHNAVSFREGKQIQNRYESALMGVLYKSLAEKRIKFEIFDDPTERGYKPDLKIYLSDDDIIDWWFCILSFPAERTIGNGPVFRAFYQLMGRLTIMEPKESRKISLLVTNENDYRLVRRYKDSMAYKGNLSVILVDLDKFAVEKEEYLAHFKEGSSETYII